MFSLNESNRYYLYPYPCDMRKSFYTLSGIISNRMGMNLREGSAFIFINKGCTAMKILHMECGGLVIYHMKLEQGSFHLPCIDTDNDRKMAVETFWNELVLIVQGIDTTQVKRHKRWSPASWNL
ncbi:MAG: IS66 family insertion sequence element accessory protein TnpB [Prevotella sp.]|nr:IS66 family insertion sequence element accessory protein TnpB [Prevotella sp.]